MKIKDVELSILRAELDATVIPPRGRCTESTLNTEATPLQMHLSARWSGDPVPPNGQASSSR